MKTIYLGGGCFWGVEKYVAMIPGVLSTEVGYINGKTRNPNYEDVCYGNTGHAEAVKVDYNPEKIKLDELLTLFYKVIDPIAVNKQGPDVGVQYRSGIYYTNADDEVIIRKSLEKLQKNYTEPLGIEMKRMENYSAAEEYHQKYLDKNPGGYCHIGSEAFECIEKEMVKINAKKYVKKDLAKLRKLLTDMQYKVTQEGKTEPPFINKYNDNFKEGIYVDITTGQPLFLSTDKFESGCGWPSFSRPISWDLLMEVQDNSYGMMRTEVKGKGSESHLGHVFRDGPVDRGGLRYCINSAALDFIPKNEMAKRGYEEYLVLLEK